MLTLLLNYLPWIIVVATLAAMAHYKYKANNIKMVAWSWAIGTFLFFGTIVVGPHYMPKGEPIVRNDTPAFEVKEAEVKNNLREMDEKVQADLEKKLDWKEKTEENKNE